MDATAKEALLARLSAYLDGLDAIPHDPTASEPDQFSVVAELVALKSEVKLEARQVKAAMDLFRETFEILRQAHARLEADMARQREQDLRMRKDGERAILLELIELRDRLQAGHGHLTNYKPSWLARQGGAAAYVAEVAVGQAMLLHRLDEILSRRDLKPLLALGQRFDPLTMHAVQTAQDPNIDDGIVVAETRAGFMCNGQLLRPSEVTVNKIITPLPSCN